MGHITIKETIEAPVTEVFGYVDDYKNTTKYMKDLVLWEPTSDVVHGKGATFECGMKAGPTTLKSHLKMTSWVENKTIGWISTEGFQQTGKWQFKDKDGTTEVVFDMEYELPGGIAGRVLGKAAEPVVRMNLEHSVAALKDVTERLAKKRSKATSAK
jgi:uncharacterized membrane protein